MCERERACEREIERERERKGRERESTMMCVYTKRSAELSSGKLIVKPFRRYQPKMADAAAHTARNNNTTQSILLSSVTNKQIHSVEGQLSNLWTH